MLHYHVRIEEIPTICCSLMRGHDMFYVGMACMIQRRIKDLSIP